MASGDTANRVITVGKELRDWIAQQARLLGGFIAALAILVYPAGLVVSWLQLQNCSELNSSEALYAASLISNTMVAGKAPVILFASICSNAVIVSLVLQVWCYRDMYKDLYSMKGNPFGLQDPKSPPADGMVTLGHYIFTSQRFAIIVFALVSPAVFVMEAGGSFSWLIYGIFILFCVISSYALSFWVRDAARETSYQKLFSTLSLIYVSAILAAVCLAGSLGPSLPTVKLEMDNGVQTYALLGHSSGYWHVIDQGEILALPDDQAGKVRVVD